MEKERHIPKAQMDFALEGNQFVQPISLKDLEFGINIISLLGQRKLWNKRPTGNCAIYAEINDDSKIIYFNPDNYQIINQPKEKQKSTYSGVVIKISDDNEFKLDSVENFLSVVKAYLIYEAPVLIIEEKEGLIDKESRLSILSNADLVERKIVTSKFDGLCLWEGRSEKKNKPHKAINLLDKNRPKFYYCAERLWREMEKKYNQAGFKILNRKNSEIIERMRKSTNPPDDFSRLKMGWGVELEGVCGCHLKRGINGIDSYFFICEEHKKERDIISS